MDRERWIKIVSKFKEFNGNFNIEMPWLRVNMKGDFHTIRENNFNPDKELDGSESEKEATIEGKRFDSDKEIIGNEKEKEVTIEKKKFDPDKEITGSEQEKSIEYVKCLNEKLEGQCHEETGVPFEKRVIELEDKKIEGVFPKFESVFDVQLPKEMLTDKDKVQFKECNAQLKNAIENNPELYEKFTEEQREQIRNGDTPDGYVWHHDAEVGKLQLVDFEAAPFHCFLQVSPDLPDVYLQM